MQHQNTAPGRGGQNRIKDETVVGRRFGRLIVLQREPGHGRSRFVCRCDCGVEKVIGWNRLRDGDTRSCGCLQRELTAARAAVTNVKHGHARRGSIGPLYSTWRSMHERCNNPNAMGFKNYGGRGITVCERWHDFEKFLADMGERPAGLTLDRIDNDGNYEPGNCRWATWKEQRANQRGRVKA